MLRAASLTRLGSFISDASNDEPNDSFGRQKLLSWRMKRWIGSREDLNSMEDEPDPTCVEVLSVDDDNVNQMVIEKVMGQVGFSVIKAMDARACLNILSERFQEGGVKAFPSIILMDQRMPHMTGLEATKIIRERYAASRVPIIMLSANDDERSIVEGLQNGCNDYVTKPFKQMELITRMSLQLRIIQFHKREMEARQNEQILNEILPASIIQRLKDGQTNIADELEEVTILFSDICGFTELAAQSTTLAVIHMLDTLFSSFDHLVTEHGVYKVETIGVRFTPNTQTQPTVPNFALGGVTPTDSQEGKLAQTHMHKATGLQMGRGAGRTDRQTQTHTHTATGQQVGGPADTHTHTHTCTQRQASRWAEGRVGRQTRTSRLAGRWAIGRAAGGGGGQLGLCFSCRLHRAMPTPTHHIIKRDTLGKPAGLALSSLVNFAALCRTVPATFAPLLCCQGPALATVA